MEIGIFLFWLLMAIITSMVATARKGIIVGVVFFFYGALIWPIALVHALLLKPRTSVDAPLVAEGVIDGRPYWRTRDGQFCAKFDDRDIAFPTLAMLEAALRGETVQATETDDRLIGQRLVDWIISK